MLGSNVEADPYQVSPDSYWHDLIDGEASEFAVIAVAAWNSNQLGVYQEGLPGTVQYVTDPQSSYLGLGVYLGDGSEGDPYPGGLNPLSNQSFGFALKSLPYNGGDATEWFSDQAFNMDNADHMLSYHLAALAGHQIYIDLPGDNGKTLITLTEDTYLLAWEDRAAHDWDYNDGIYLVSRVHPIPEPMSMLLLGSGLLGLIGLRRKVS